MNLFKSLAAIAALVILTGAAVVLWPSSASFFPQNGSDPHTGRTSEMGPGPLAEPLLAKATGPHRQAVPDTTAGKPLKAVGHLGVQVRFAPSQPAAGFAVRIHPATPEGFADAPTHVGTTDAAGALELDLAVGTYRVIADGSAVAWELAEVQPNKRVDLTLTLTPTTTVHGVVRDQHSGLPLAGAELQGPNDVELLRPPITTDALGRFALKGWPIGPLAGITANAPGYGMERVFLTVGVDGTWEIPPRFGWPREIGPAAPALVEIQLVPEKVIQGSIELAEGLEALVEVQGRFLVKDRISHHEARSQHTTESFHFQGLRSDITHALRITAPGRADLVIESPPGPFLDLGSVRLAPERYVTGTVVDAMGRALPGLPIEVRIPRTEVYRPPAETQAGANTERDGWRGMPARRYVTACDATGAFRVAVGFADQLELHVGPVRSFRPPVALVTPWDADIDAGRLNYTGEGELLNLVLKEFAGPGEVTISSPVLPNRVELEVADLAAFTTWWDPSAAEVELTIRPFDERAETAHLGPLPLAELQP